MDPLTHGLLGATCAQALWAQKLGRRALWVGALASMAPDLDIVMAVAPLGEFLHHRGLTHSLWFGPVAGTLLGAAFWRWRAQREPGASPAWISLLVVTLLSHSLLDVFTTYGTQLLSPFSPRRFSFDGVAIVDPLYSLVLAAALLVGLRRGAGSRIARRSAAAALALTTAYVFYGFRLNESVKASVRSGLEAEGVHGADVQAYPTLLQIFLRRVVVRAGDEVRVGWVTPWRRGPVDWSVFPIARDPETEEARRTREGRVFEWFAMGQTVARVERGPSGAVVEIDDLRFGFPPRPREGLWGMRFRFDARLGLVGPGERFNRPLPLPAGELLAQLWRFTFGAGSNSVRKTPITSVSE